MKIKNTVQKYWVSFLLDSFSIRYNVWQTGAIVCNSELMYPRLSPGASFTHKDKLNQEQDHGMDK